MKLIRNNVFETNSSSTHTLTIGKQQKDYLAPSKTLTIDFIDTDKEFTLGTLKEKVSYLVSQIIEKYKYVFLLPKINEITFSNVEKEKIIIIYKKV